uniref:Glycosyltransferase n=1 Tax=Dictyoglomus thermophilum TaxID=14 RepID=A0A7C3RRQ7_DICTH
MKKILIITNAPFLKAGNQSLRRTIEGLVSKNYHLEIWSIANIDDNIYISDFSNVKINLFLFPRFIKKIIEIIKKYFKFIRNNILSIFKRDKHIINSFYVEDIVEFRNDHHQWIKGFPYLIFFGILIFIYVLKRYKNLKKEIDIIWGYERFGVIIGYILSKILRKPFIASFQGTVLYPYVNKYGRLGTFIKLPIDYVALRLKADLKIMTNDGTKGDKVIRLLGDIKSPILHIPNGVDYYEIERCTRHVHKNFKRILNLKDTDILTVTAYRLDKWKRIDRVIFFISYLIKNGYKNVYLYIIGDGPERIFLENIVLKESLTENIKFLGAINYCETLKYIKGADLILSFCDYSNLTNTVQDAICLGKWIFTIDDGSIDELFNYFDLTKVIKIPLNNFLDNGVDKFIYWYKNYYRRDNNYNDVNSSKIWTWNKRIDTICNYIEKTLINN